MTAKEYQKMREEIGTQRAVAKHFGVSESTFGRRENGSRITREAEIAIKAAHACGLKLPGKRGTNKD